MRSASVTTGPVNVDAVHACNSGTLFRHLAVANHMQREQLVLLRRMLSLQLATLEAQNKEVAGDDDAEEEDEGMGALDVEAPALQVE